MPYVNQESRYMLKQLTDMLEEAATFVQPGGLNYLITKLVHAYWEANPQYSTIAIIDGVLANVAREFYRRVAVPYEDRKIAENGDVFNA
jgi:hypothetical protein